MSHTSKVNSEHFKKNQPGNVQELSNLIISLLRACPRRVTGWGGGMHDRVTRDVKMKNSTTQRCQSGKQRSNLGDPMIKQGPNRINEFKNYNLLPF